MRMLSKGLLAFCALMAAASSSMAADIQYAQPQVIENVPTFNARRFSFGDPVDLDKDGDLDFLYGNIQEYSVKWLENVDGQNGVYTTRSITKPGFVIPVPEAPVAVDLDGDNDLDVVATGTNPNFNPPEIAWFENDGNVYTGSWKKRTIELQYYRHLFALNLTNDDKPDLLGFNSGSGAYYVNQGTTPVEFALPHSAVSAPAFGDMRKASLDGDGDVDFLAISTTALRQIEVQRGSTPTFTTTNLASPSRTILQNLSLPVCTLADLTGDGLPEFAYVPDNDDRRVVVMDNVGGSSIFGGETDYPLPSTVGHAFGEILKLGAWDMDGDGDMDLFAHTETGKSYFLRNLGGESVNLTPVTADVPIFFNLAGSRGDLMPFDYDEDGDPDIMSNSKPQVGTSSALNWSENLTDEDPLILRSVGVTESIGDGALQPGEPGTFDLLIRNLSALPVSTASIDLSGTSQGIVFASTIQQVDIIPPGADYSQQVPFYVSDVAECGSVQTLQATLKFGNAIAGSGSMDRPVGTSPAGPVITAHAEEAVASTIPDGNQSGVSRQLTPAGIGDATIDKIRVFVNITHPYRGDIQLNIVSPQGTRRTFYSGSPTDFANDIVQTFALDSLDGEIASGVYTLEAIDRVTGDAGTLNSWSLDVDYLRATCTVTPVTTMVRHLMGLPTDPVPADTNADGRLDCADLIAGQD